MNLGRLHQIILKSDKEISGSAQSAQHAIFAFHMVWQTPLVALPPLRFPDGDQVLVSNWKCVAASSYVRSPYNVISYMRRNSRLSTLSHISVKLFEGNWVRH